MTGTTVRPRGRVGESAHRIDGAPKTTGEYLYGGDLSAPGMLWGVTLRSPHPSARIRRIDTTRARAVPGVRALLTGDDVPGRKTYGLEISDQPVLATEVVRYEGEAVAIVAADTLAAAREALALVEVAYEPLEPLDDMEAALAPGAPQLHPFGNVLRHVHIDHGDLDAAVADVWVEGHYETGMQDQAPVGCEGGIAIPAADGGVDIYVATQWLHVDRQQIAPCLGLPEDKVRVTLAGVGGAFGSREDVSMQIHASLLALKTGLPVKMAYGREESFHGHVHRHPARIWLRYGATREGTLVAAEARIVLDGGAYASSSPAVLVTASTFAVGPYDVPNVRVEGTVVYTNNPPCGAMRGFGAPQVCFAHEALMDELAAQLCISPIELRMRNVVGPGSVLPTGQVLQGSTPVREVLERCRALPLPPREPSRGRDAFDYPGGATGVNRGEHVRRAVGFALGFKNVAYSEGFDDASEATVTLSQGPEGPVASILTSAVDYGQGLYTVLAQIARTELGVEEVVVLPATTDGVGSAGSTSASRQTTMTGGAVLEACKAVRAELDARGGDLAAGSITCTREFHHRPTTQFDEHGQGDIHTSIAFAAHRAVVDVDMELGVTRVVQIAAVHDIGHVVNPVGAEGQVEGGTAQGLGLALMEEIVTEHGVMKNPSFTDYLVPTVLDVPPIVTEFVEVAEKGAPYGVKGIGELPTVVAPAAIAAALRQATGRPLRRLPIRADDLLGLREDAQRPEWAPVPHVPGQQPVPEYAGLELGQQELMS
ncbi:MAG TPA: molybdopterin cofactor-binding domain-containing protein [Gaiellaceae bacterium]